MFPCLFIFTIFTFSLFIYFHHFVSVSYVFHTYTTILFTVTFNTIWLQTAPFIFKLNNFYLLVIYTHLHPPPCTFTQRIYNIYSNVCKEMLSKERKNLFGLFVCESETRDIGGLFGPWRQDHIFHRPNTLISSLATLDEEFGVILALRNPLFLLSLFIKGLPSSSPAKESPIRCLKPFSQWGWIAI